MICHAEDLTFYVLSIGTFHHKKGTYRVQPREHSALSFRTHGTGVFRIQGQCLSSRPGEVLYIPAGIGYEVDYTESESIVIHLLHCSYRSAETITLHTPEYVREKFRGTLARWEQERNINRAKSDIYDILWAMGEDQSAAFDRTFLESLQYMQAHFRNPALQISDVCAAVGLSESSLYRRFLAHYSQSPKEYLQNLRLRHAIELLLRGALSVKEVALQSGFRDEKYFSRFISQKLGKPPSGIRQAGWVGE